MTNLQSRFNQLSPNNKPIPISATSLQILQTPSDFYTQLLHNIHTAQNCISLASLYMGNTSSSKEKELLNAIERACSKKKDLKVRFLLDYSRGTRKHKGCNSLDLIHPLLSKFGHERIQVHFYKVPQLDSGVKEAVLKSPLNEIIGVFHIKAYAFDDVVILSGANLSHDYFTNRQDRYIQFHSKELAGFYHDLIDVISQYSYNYKLDRPHPKSLQEFRNSLDGVLHSIPSLSKECDTFAFPTLQFTPINLNHDKNTLTALLTKSQGQDCTMQIASGYLNFPPYISHLILQSSCEKLDIITAAPQSNGFYNAPKFKGTIPMAYSAIEQDLYHKLKPNMNIHEYIKTDWTFHAKGLWISNKQEMISIIGSSNFGQRSFGRDLESQVYLYTKNAALREALAGECRYLMQDCELVTGELWEREGRRFYGFGWKNGVWIRPLSRLIASFL